MLTRLILLATLNPEPGLQAVDRLQGAWERGWQSATAAVLLVVWLITLVLLLRSQHLRVKDRDRLQDKLEALAREGHAGLAENAKQVFVFNAAVHELKAQVQELRGQLQEALSKRRPPPGPPRGEGHP